MGDVQRTLQNSSILGQNVLDIVSYLKYLKVKVFEAKKIFKKDDIIIVFNFQIDLDFK